MELIRKHYQSIISYGIIIFGTLTLATILIVKPSRTILEEAYSYNQKPKLTPIDFPFSQTIKTPDNNPTFVELRFGDDSINQYRYTVTATHKSIPFFNHTYENEASNIIRIPIDYSKIEPIQNSEITIHINCENVCTNTQFELYEINDEQTIKSLYGIQKIDYGLLWYGLFPITIGLTLLPLVNKRKKHA